MRIALFGGTFDPIHGGHLKIAEAARQAFHLDRILFVPSGNPPHKRSHEVTPFAHRFAMVVLACAGSSTFVPSLLEGPREDRGASYSIDTVRRARRMLAASDRLYFLLGADAFLDLPRWRDARRLLNSVDFIVVSRPGFSSDQIRAGIPPGIARAAVRDRASDRIRLQKRTVWILPGVKISVASRNIRRQIRGGRRFGAVPPLVEEYIVKEGLYRPPRWGRKAE